MERNDTINITRQFHEFVRRLVNKGAEFQFAFIIEQIYVIHFAEAFSAAVAAVITYFKVFFTAVLTAASL
jgi:hypothetical protein